MRLAVGLAGISGADYRHAFDLPAQFLGLEQD